MILIFLLCLTAVYAQDQKNYDGWSLVKVSPNEESQLNFLTNLRQNLKGLEFQVWQEGGIVRPYELFVSPDAKELLITLLQGQNIPFVIKSHNVQEAIDNEQKPAQASKRGFFSPATSTKIQNQAWFTKFLKLNEINAAIQLLVQQYPKLVSTESIGKTYMGKNITLVKLSTGGANKPAIWIDGGIHAREWASPATVLYILNKLVTQYSTDKTIKNYIDKLNFYIVINVNPDGYEYTHAKDRMWRKNRRPGTNGCDGVDLNRNFDYGFGGLGTSNDPCEDIYCGPSAFSEPESQAVRDYLLSHKDIQAYLTIHAYSQMWFYPYGDKKNSYPPDVNELIAVAQEGAKRLEAVWGTEYQVGTAADLLYEAAGGSDDWSKGKAGIKYVYTLEVRPNDDGESNGFILPSKQIIPTGEETFAGLSAVWDAVIAKSG